MQLLILVLYDEIGVMQIALVLRDHAAEAYRVPAGAMPDTILPGDRFLADKLLPLEPARGDVVVFSVEQHGAPLRGVKRVIGLPGERVEARGAKAWSEGRELDEP